MCHTRIWFRLFFKKKKIKNNLYIISKRIVTGFSYEHKKKTNLELKHSWIVGCNKNAKSKINSKTNWFAIWKENDNVSLHSETVLWVHTDRFYYVKCKHRWMYVIDDKSKSKIMQSIIIQSDMREEVNGPACILIMRS